MKDLNTKKSASVFSKLFFTWTMPILWRGNSRILTQEDIPSVQGNDETEHLVNILEKNWKNEVVNGDPSLTRALFKMFGRRFFVFLTIVFVQQCVIRISVPILLGLLIRYVNGIYGDDIGYLLAVAFVILIFLSTIIQQRAWFALDHLGMQARIAVTGLIFQKIFRLSTSTVRKTGIGQLTNIISNDVNRFDRLKDTPYILTVPIQILLAWFVLWSYLGLASVAGISVLILIVPIQGVLARQMGKWRAVIAEKTDRRIRLLAEILDGMLLIKMSTWENPYTEAMTEARGKEMKCIKRKNHLMALNYTLFDVAPKASIFVTFLTFTLMGHTLSAEAVFVTLAMYSLVTSSSSIYFPQGMSGFSEVLVSIRRIESILLLEEKPESGSTSISAANDSCGVCVSNLCAKWSDEANSAKIINDISFQMKSGEFLGIVGPVGSGKSSLLLAVLGEMCNCTGTVNLNGRVAYVPQDPWIFTGSIRENILFGLPFDSQWYSEVIKTCALLRDLNHLQLGDQTLVGERGMNLSGGQKSRISLARAIYSRADLYLLDDPLSAVDTRVAATLMDKCIRGILKDKCVILVTHQTQYLKEASEIISLQDGRINERCSYVTLFSNGNVTEETKNEDLNETSIDQLLEAAGETESNGFSTDVLQRSGETAHQAGELAETKQVGNVGWSTYWTYVKSGNPLGNLVIIALLLLVSQLVISGSDLWLRSWTDAASKNARNNTEQFRYSYEGEFSRELFSDEVQTDLTYLYVYAGMMFGILCLSLIKVLRLFCALASSSVQIYRKVFASVIRAPMRFFELNSTGRIMNRFSSDVGNMDEVLPQRFYILIGSTLVSAGSVSVIIYLSLPLALPTLILLVVFYLLIKFYVKPGSAIKRLESTARSPIFGLVATSLSGLPSIRAYGVQTQFINQFKNSQNIHTANFYMYLTSCRWLQLFVELASNFYVTAVLLYLLHSTTNATAFGLAIASVLSFSATVTPGMTQAAEMINYIVSVERVVDYSNITPEARLQRPSFRLNKRWPSKGGIQMNNVQVVLNNQNILNDITLHVKPGEKIGIVGRTGAGKSTLISTLFRIVEPNAGEILIDNLNISCIGLHELRQKLSIIPQTPILFSGTIRRNLDPFSERSDTDICAALQSVQLTNRLASQTNAVADILSTQVSEGGSNFSQGERQLICLARAILEKNKIVILDEATANMDRETDAIIQDTMRREFSSSTLLIIAHRLETVIETDRILFLDNGLIKEFDEPRRLVEDTNSFLFKLVQSTGESYARRLIEMAQNPKFEVA